MVYSVWEEGIAVRRRVHISDPQSSPVGVQIGPGKLRHFRLNLPVVVGEAGPLVQGLVRRGAVGFPVQGVDGQGLGARRHHQGFGDPLRLGVEGDDDTGVVLSLGHLQVGVLVQVLLRHRPADAVGGHQQVLVGRFVKIVLQQPQQHLGSLGEPRQDQRPAVVDLRHVVGKRFRHVLVG